MYQMSSKRQHDDDESEGDDEEEDDQIREDSMARTASDNDYSDGNLSPSRKQREPRSCTLKDNDGIILKQMLNHLIKILQK